MVRKELKTHHAALKIVFIQCSVAWITAFIVYNVGCFLFGNNKITISLAQEII
jgi:Fe2+ transport system protein B